MSVDAPSDFEMIFMQLNSKPSEKYKSVELFKPFPLQDSMFKIWDFCSYHMRPFSIQDLKASLECEENVSISLINEIFGVIIKIYLAENRKGL